MSGAIGIMRALVGDALGPPEMLAVADLPLPVPGAGDVRIAVEAVTFGFVDGLVAAGRYQVRPPLPFVPGGEIAGVIDAIGADVVLRHLVASRPGDVTRIRQNLFEMARIGTLQVSIGQRLRLADAMQSLVLLEARERIGKIAILPQT